MRILLAFLLTTGCYPCEPYPICKYEESEPTNLSITGQTLANNKIIRGAEVSLIAEDGTIIEWQISNSSGHFELQADTEENYWLFAGYSPDPSLYTVYELGWIELGDNKTINVNLNIALPGSSAECETQITDFLASCDTNCSSPPSCE